MFLFEEVISSDHEYIFFYGDILEKGTASVHCTWTHVHDQPNE